MPESITDALRRQNRGDWVRSFLLMRQVQQLSAALLSGTVLLHDDLARLGAQLADIAEQAQRATAALESPQATQAAELARRGFHALRNQWLPEAASELRNAVELDPYNPKAWFGLGLTHAQLGEQTEALDAWQRSMRYDAGNTALGATACILALSGLKQLGQDEGLQEVADAALTRWPDYAEVKLAAGIANNSPDLVHAAVYDAPELAFPAVAFEAPGAMEAVSTVVSDYAAIPQVVARLRPWWESISVLAVDQILAKSQAPEFPVELEPTADPPAQIAACVSFIEDHRDWVAELARLSAALPARQQEIMNERSGDRERRTDRDAQTLYAALKRTGYSTRGQAYKAVGEADALLREYPAEAWQRLAGDCAVLNRWLDRRRPVAPSVEGLS